MVSVGVDIHKASGFAVVKDDGGRVVASFTFKNDKCGIGEFVERLQGFRDVRVAVESSGNFWVKLYEALEAKGFRVVLSNPARTKAIAEAKIRSDRLDASTLADLLRAGLVAESYVPPKHVRDVRALLRYRVSLVRERTRVKNRVHALLDKHEVSVGFTDLFGARGRSWLRSLKLPGNDGLILKLALDEVDRLDGLIDEVSRVIAGEAVEDPRVELLLGYKGIDYYTAMVVLYEVGDINRFCSARKFVGWVGLCPSVHQSGEHCRRGGITKQGNKWVRWALVQAAHQAARHDPKLRCFFERVAARRGVQKAIIAVARKLAVSIYYVLKRNEPYHGEDAGLRRRKVNRLRRMVS
jgi:transposase